MDEIDELIDYQLSLPKSSTPFKLQVQCEQCKGEWHGLPKGNCPGLVVPH